MSVEQLPVVIREFTSYLNELVGRLDQSGGWCGVFWQRDPDGMRAFLQGNELPPWDVVADLLQDLAAGYGPRAAESETARARALHAAARTAYDARPGARDALGDRLDVMLREQRYAAERHTALSQALSTAPTPADAETLRLDLAWAQDDHARAMARCAELRARMAELDQRSRPGANPDGGAPQAARPPHPWDPAPGTIPGSAPGAPHPWDADPGQVTGSAPGAAEVPGSGPQWGAAPASGPASTQGAAAPRSGSTAGPMPAAGPAAGSGSADARESVYGSGPRTVAGSAPGPGPQDAAAPDVSVRGAGEAPGSASGGASGPGAAWAPGADQGADGGVPGSGPRWGVASAQGPASTQGAGVPGAVSGPEPTTAVGSALGSSPSADAQGSVVVPGPRTVAGSAPGPGPQDPAAQGGVAGPESLSVPGSVPGPRAAPGSPTMPPPPTAAWAHRGSSAPPPPTVPSATTPPPPEPTATGAPVPGSEPPRPSKPAKPPKARKRRRGSARFAGAVEDEDAPVVVPPAVVPPAAEPAVPVPSAPAASRTPRGARFAGAAGAGEEQQAPPVVREVLTDRDRREITEVVGTLARLRAAGRGGEAHALLIDVAHWPAARFPLLAAGMERAGLGPDWATLLWETASLPVDRLVAAADALTAAGRTEDGEQILRQGVVRPAEEIAGAVLALAAGQRQREVGALLDAYVRMRTPEESARCAAIDPQQLVPLLLTAARGVSEERYFDLLHALRVAGTTT